jgi:hypothetical protein
MNHVLTARDIRSCSYVTCRVARLLIPNPALNLGLDPQPHALYHPFQNIELYTHVAWLIYKYTNTVMVNDLEVCAGILLAWSRIVLILDAMNG